MNTVVIEDSLPSFMLHGSNPGCREKVLGAPSLMIGSLWTGGNLNQLTDRECVMSYLSKSLAGGWNKSENNVQILIERWGKSFDLWSLRSRSPHLSEGSDVALRGAPFIAVGVGDLDESIAMPCEFPAILSVLGGLSMLRKGGR